MNNKLGTILPIHQFSESIGELLKESLISVKEQKETETIPTIYIVGPENIFDDIKTITNEFSDVITFSFIKNDGDTSFQSQINLAASSISEDYFSILEFDDEVNSTYYKNINKHIEKLGDVDLFLSMVILTNPDNKPVDFSNQQVWSKQFVGDNGTMGYLNNDLLGEYSDFKICGAIFNREKFNSIGGLKTNIKLTFQYEFLLRLLNNNGKIYTIPKLGYKHMLLREGSLFDYYMKNIPLKERKFWFDVATKEYYFNNERDINTSQLTVVE